MTSTQKAKYAKCGYTHAVLFVREHVKSPLTGLTGEDFFPFCSAQACEDWVLAINARPAKVWYRIVSHTVVAL